MAIRYYKKLDPQTQVALTNRATVRFSTVNGLTGYYATDNAYIQEEFLKCMQEQRYGITEISEADFKTEYLDEKKSPGTVQTATNPSWREEMGQGKLSRSTPLDRLGSEAVAAAVGVSGATDVPKRLGGSVIADPVPAKPVTAPAKREEFNPPVGRRPKRT